MRFFMVRDKKTGLFYKRVHNRFVSPWVDQEEASVWTTKDGAHACLGAITRWMRDYHQYPEHYSKPKIVEPEIVEIPAVQQKPTLVCADDWRGLYIDGKLVEEGHSMPFDAICRHLGIDGAYMYADDEWLAERGSLPENLEDVRRG